MDWTLTAILIVAVILAAAILGFSTWGTYKLLPKSLKKGRRHWVAGVIAFVVGLVALYLAFLAYAFYIYQ